MTARNTSRLEAGLIARKGEAAPAQSSANPPAGTAGESTPPASQTPRGVQGTIAVTVRLDPNRYERMKVHGARRRRTNQDILVEALDRYFASLAE